MNKEEYAQYLDSNHWKSLRRKRLEASGYRCDQCGSGFNLQVHHLRYRNIYDVLVSDLQTLCSYCHEKKHGITSGRRPINPKTNTTPIVASSPDQTKRNLEKKLRNLNYQIGLSRRHGKIASSRILWKIENLKSRISKLASIQQPTQ